MDLPKHMGITGRIDAVSYLSQTRHSALIITAIAAGFACRTTRQPFATSRQRT
jgi:hypothetical protein